VSGWLQLAGYIVCIWILVNVTIGVLAIWNSRLDKREEAQDEPEVRAFREQLDTWDSSLFLESSDIRSEE
jgi:hypothetical protein